MYIILLININPYLVFRKRPPGI